jgi:RNA polymerase sigma factor (sigma-70 family)
MEHLTDEALVERVRQGYRDAYGVLVERHKNSVFTLIRCKVEDWETAEDLAQEVFLKLYRFLPGYRGDSQFSTWLYSLTLNTVKDHLKSKRRRPATTVMDTIRGWFAEAGQGPEEQAIKREEQETVTSILRSLPDKYRNILYLYHYRQMSYSEIALTLELPVKTVETRLYRGKKLLKDQWLEVNGHELDSSERPHTGAVSKPQSDT